MKLHAIEAQRRSTGIDTVWALYVTFSDGWAHEHAMAYLPDDFSPIEVAHRLRQLAAAIEKGPLIEGEGKE